MSLEDFWVEKYFQICQRDQLTTQIRFSYTTNLESAIWGVGTENMRLEKGVGLVSLHGCAKKEITMLALDFCTEEMLVRLRYGKETMIKFKNPITEVFH